MSQNRCLIVMVYLLIIKIRSNAENRIIPALDTKLIFNSLPAHWHICYGVLHQGLEKWFLPR